MDDIAIKFIKFKIEKDRVLVPVGDPCLFACLYCYTRGGEVGASRVPGEEIIAALKAFIAKCNSDGEDFETIQFGYDGDPFAQIERGMMMLRMLSELDKHLNFSTKAFINDDCIDSLVEIKDKLAASDRTLSALVSLSCWQSACRLEPNTPKPKERMVSIKNLSRIGIPTFVAMRPILPIVPDDEYLILIDECLLAGCSGFILGPLYGGEDGRYVRFIRREILNSMTKTAGVVPWSAHAPIWNRYEDKERLWRFSEIIHARGGRVFDSSADAMKFVNGKKPVA